MARQFCFEINWPLGRAQFQLSLWKFDINWNWSWMMMRWRVKEPIKCCATRSLTLTWRHLLTIGSKALDGAFNLKETGLFGRNNCGWLNFLLNESQFISWKLRYSNDFWQFCKNGLVLSKEQQLMRNCLLSGFDHRYWFFIKCCSRLNVIPQNNQSK